MLARVLAVNVLCGGAVQDPLLLCDNLKEIVADPDNGLTKEEKSYLCDVVAYMRQWLVNEDLPERVTA